MGKQPIKRGQNAIGKVVGALAADILTEVKDLLRDRSKPDATVIHEYRRAMKRWRALLRLLEPELGPKAAHARKMARDLARQIAGPRDLQSAIDALQYIGVQSPRAMSGRLLPRLRDRLEAMRTHSEKVAFDATVRKRFLQALRNASDFVRQWPLQELSFDRLVHQFVRRYRCAQRAVPDNWMTAKPKALHKLRQHTVELRYQTEVFMFLWPRLGKAWIREAQSLRRELGHYHDLVVLARYTRAGQPLAQWRNRLGPLIAKRQAAHVAEARVIAARLFAEPPKILRSRYLALWKAQRRA